VSTPKKVALANGVVRWRVVHDVGHGAGYKRRQITRTFDDEAAAVSFLAEQAAARQTSRDQRRNPNTAATLWADILDDVSGGLDPVGFYVYLLWARKDDKVPLYVGCSANILGRLGQHLGDGTKKAQVGWVSIIRCNSRETMLAREAALIRKYMPAWNAKIPNAYFPARVRTQRLRDRAS
jgi:hypothetical protein